MTPLTDLHPAIAYVLATALALGALSAAWKAVAVPIWRAIRLFGRFLDEWFGSDDRKPIPVRLAEMEKSVAEVHHQTHPNGGASIKDIVVRTERRVVDLERNLRSHVEESRDRDRRIAELEAERRAPHNPSGG